MITVTFTGENVPEVVGQMLAFIGEARPQSYPTRTPVSAEEAARSEFVRSYEAKKKRGRPPKQRETEAEQIDRIEDAAVHAIKARLEKETVEAPPIEVVSEEEADEVSEVEAPPSDAIANEKIKQEVIAQLSDLFTAGKVKTLRHILDTYGRGAKSFPEIDASAFPQIREALNRGEAA